MKIHKTLTLLRFYYSSVHLPWHLALQLSRLHFKCSCCYFLANPGEGLKATLYRSYRTFLDTHQMTRITDLIGQSSVYSERMAYKFSTISFLLRISFSSDLNKACKIKKNSVSFLSDSH